MDPLTTLYRIAVSAARSVVLVAGMLFLSMLLTFDGRRYQPRVRTWEDRPEPASSARPATPRAKSRANVRGAPLPRRG